MSIVVKTARLAVLSLIKNFSKYVLGQIVLKLLHIALGCEGLTQLKCRVNQQYISRFLRFNFILFKSSYTKFIKMIAYALQGAALEILITSPTFKPSGKLY
jgi:hypothetical protein